MREFIEELKHNQEVNIEKGLENRVNIDYVIERLEDNKNLTKVYVIRYEDLCSGEYSSGVCYVFDTLDKAKTMLEEIKKDEICSSDLENIKDSMHDLVTEEGFIIDYNDDYSKYVIEEMEVQ